MSRLGTHVSETPTTSVLYDGQSLPRFLQVNNSDPTGYRAFLRLNRIGNPFEIPTGISVQVIQDQTAFAQHPEA